MIEISSIDQVKTYPFAIVEFFSIYCSDCRNIAPHLLKFETEFKNVVFAKVDIIKNMELSELEMIRSTPTFILYKSGVELDRFFEPAPKDLKNKIQSLIS